MGIAASRAEAFIGEPDVIKPGSPPTLTPGAEDVLKNPKTIPELIGKGQSFGGPAEANGAARALQIGRVLPAIGTAVAGFSAGWEIGAEICGVLGIGGCFHLYGDSGAEPVVVTGGYPSGGSWQFKDAAFIGVPSHNYVWKFGTSGGGYEAIVTGRSADCKSWNGPGDASYWITRAAKTTCLTEGGLESEGPYVTAVRLGMEGLNLQHNATDNPAIPNVAYTAPGNWSAETAAALSESAEGERVGQHIASQLEGSEVASPYSLTVEIPEECGVGQKVGPCVEELEELELVPEVEELDWEEAVVEELDELEPEETREEESEKIVEIAPPLPAEVVIGEKVELEVNPKKKDMPVFLPVPGEGADGEGEKEDEYKKRLAPIFIPDVGELDDGTLDPNKGPARVTRSYPTTDDGTFTDPDGHTRFDPDTEHPVKVWKNPETAPKTGGGTATGSWTAPSIPAIDMSPLTGISIGCSTFPFGIFCWLGDGLSGWSTSGTCSSVDVPLGTSVDPANELPFDLCQFEPAMEIIRPVLVLVATLCLGWFFAAASMGLGGGNDD